MTPELFTVIALIIVLLFIAIGATKVLISYRPLSLKDPKPEATDPLPHTPQGEATLKQRKKALLTKDNNELLDLVEYGIYPSDAHLFASYGGHSISEVSWFLGVSQSTLTGVKESLRLPDYAAERLLYLMRLYQKGEKSFGDMRAFKNWLSTPRQELNNKVPYTFFNYISGIQQVQDCLTKVRQQA